MWSSCNCCRTGIFQGSGCIRFPRPFPPFPRPYPNPSPFPPFDDPFGGCEIYGHPESSHRKGCF